MEIGRKAHFFVLKTKRKHDWRQTVQYNAISAEIVWKLSSGLPSEHAV